MPNLGFDDVRELVARKRGNGIADARGVVMTAGASAAIALTLDVFGEKSADVVCFRPYFPEYPAYVARAGMRMRTVQTNLGRPDLSALEQCLTSKTRVVILNSPANPTGLIVTEQDIDSLAVLLADRSKQNGRAIVLLADEVYAGLVFPPARHATPLGRYAFTVVARSFSKDLGLAAERIGYAIIAPDLATQEVIASYEAAQRALGFVNAPATAQRSLLYLDDWSGDYAPLQIRRDVATSLFRQAGLEFTMPQAGPFLFASVPSSVPSRWLAMLADSGVFVAPGSVFGVPDAFRISYSASRKEIKFAAGRMAALVGH